MIVRALGSLAAALLLSATATAHPRQDAAELLPADTLLAVHAPDLGGTVRALLELPAWARLDDGPLGALLTANEALNKAFTGLSAVGATTGKRRLELLDALGGDGSIFALLPPREPGAEPTAVAVFQTQDAGAVQDAFNGLLGIITLGQARVSGSDWRVPLGDGVAARRDGLFLLSNAAGALDELDASLAIGAGGRGTGRGTDRGTGRGTGRTGSLADDPAYAAARSQLQGQDLSVWARGAVFQTDPGIPERAADAGASLIAGGLAEALRTADWASLTLDVADDGLRARLVTPADSAALRETHAPFFPPAHELEVPETDARLATLVLQRDLGPWWTRRDRYLDERALADSVEGDGNLSVVFQRDLGSEVLQWLRPEVLLLVDRNRFEHGTPEPEFPAGALGFTPKDGHPEDFHQAFVNAFFALITFTNFDTADVTRPMLQPDMERLADGARLYSADWRRTADEGRLEARENLSPALLIQPDGRLWLGSSRAQLLAIDAADTDTMTVAGDQLSLDLTAAGELLASNSEVIFARRLLLEGGDPLATQEFVERLEAAAGLFDRVRLGRRLTEGWAELTLELRSL